MNDQLRSARLLRAAIDHDGPAEPTSEDWSSWVSLARTQRVIPQLFEIASTEGATLTDGQRAVALTMQLDVASTMVRLEQSLVEVADLLNSLGQSFAVLKGNATAHVDYGDPSRRQFGDVDLLVGPDQFGRVRELLGGAGWRQAYPLPRHHERFTHAITFRGSSLAEIDLHQHVAHRALGILVPTDELLENRIPFEIAGRRVWSLSDPDRLVHASLHAISSRGGYRRLSSTADVLVLAEKLAHDADLVLGRAEGWRVRPLVESGLRSAYVAAQLPVPELWMRAMAKPTRHRDRLVERAYLGDTRRPVTEEIAHLRHMRTWSDRGLYVYGHFRMDRGPGSGGLWRRIRYLLSRLRQRS